MRVVALSVVVIEYGLISAFFLKIRGSFLRFKPVEKKRSGKSPSKIEKSKRHFFSEKREKKPFDFSGARSAPVPSAIPARRAGGTVDKSVDMWIKAGGKGRQKHKKHLSFSSLLFKKKRSDSWRFKHFLLFPFSAHS
jgi:hypothetical protein